MLVSCFSLPRTPCNRLRLAETERAGRIFLFFAAEALRLTAQDLKALGVIDRIIDEPLGGAQREPSTSIAAVGASIGAMLGELSEMSGDALVKDRRQKFLDMGAQGLAA